MQYNVCFDTCLLAIPARKSFSCQVYITLCFWTPKQPYVCVHQRTLVSVLCVHIRELWYWYVCVHQRTLVSACMCSYIRELLYQHVCVATSENSGISIVCVYQRTLVLACMCSYIRELWYRHMCVHQRTLVLTLCVYIRQCG